MNSIVVAGTGRSGTTWIGQIIQSASNYPSVYEPLHLKHVPEASSIAYQYIRPGNKNTVAEKFFRKVCCGGLRRPWTDQENPGGWRKHHLRGLMRGRRVVKMIRANLMLDWLSETLCCPVVYVLRHPCAVALSWKNLDWVPCLDRYLEQAALVDDYIGPFIDSIRSAKNIEKITAGWCIENLVPIDQFASNKWIVCTYEELYLNPEREVARILDFLGLKWNKSVEKAIVQSARSTNEQSAISKGNNPLLKWQDDLQPTEISSICRMIQKFGIDIYGNEPMPDMKTFKV